MISFRVNENGVLVDVPRDTPLLWVLRDVFGMTGTKFGCGMALCGACTVHLDGTPTRSCITTIDSVGNAAVTTIEVSETPRRVSRSKGRGSISKSFNAVIASPAKLCPPRRCWRAARVRLIPTSTTQCQAISAAAGPICESARRSSAPCKRAERKADNDP